MPEAMGELVTLQRHSTKIDVQLEPLATFEAFEKHVGAKFELADGVRETRAHADTLQDTAGCVF